MFKNKVLIGVFLLVSVIALLAAPESAFARKKAAKKDVIIEELPALKGPKKTVGVLSFENKSGFSGGLSLGSEFSEMLTEALMKSGQFIVVARQELGAVITEQDMAASSRFAASKTAVKGKLVPAQIIIKGAVTEFDARSKGGTGGVRLGNLGFGNIGLSGSSSKAHVGVIVYIIDSTSGEVLDSQRVEGDAKSSGLGVDYAYSNWLSLGGADFKRTPLGKATQITINKAVDYIADRLGDIPWSGSIAKIDGDTVYINAGSTTGIGKGDAFNVWREDEALTDPITGASLGSERSSIGQIIVSEVKEKYSKAKIIGCSSDMLRGDLVTE